MALKVLQVSAIDLTIYKFILPLMKRLKGEGVEVCFACRDLGYMNVIEESGFRGFKLGIKRNVNPISAILTVFQLYKILKIEKVDIIHVHTPVAAVLGRIAAKLAGTSHIVYTVHGFYVNNCFFYNIEKLFCKYFTDFIFTVNSEDLEFAIREGFAAKDRITSINSIGIDTYKFDPAAILPADREKVRETLGIQAKDKVIGFVGRVVQEKGVIDLYKAFKGMADNNPDVKLLLAGPWDLGERDTCTKKLLDDMIRQDEMRGRVLFTGHREDIPTLLSVIDIFVLPSYREGMPVSLLEAMAMELPVIATDIRGCREEIDEHSGLLYKPGDITGLRNAIETLLKDRKRAAEMGKIARCRVVELFEQHKSIEKQMELYKSYVRNPM